MACASAMLRNAGQSARRNGRRRRLRGSKRCWHSCQRQAAGGPARPGRSHLGGTGGQYGARAVLRHAAVRRVFPRPGRQRAASAARLGDRIPEGPGGGGGRRRQSETRDALAHPLGDRGLSPVVRSAGPDKGQAGGTDPQGRAPRAGNRAAASAAAALQRVGQRRFRRGGAGAKPQGFARRLPQR